MIIPFKGHLSNKEGSLKERLRERLAFKVPGKHIKTKQSSADAP
jgi:hypothetical protein